MNQDIKNFRNHKIIFCDSEDSLKQSFKQGLRKDSLIRTSSPALLINKKLKTKAIKPKINKKLHLDFHYSVLSFVEEVYKKFINNKKFKNYAILIARQALLLQPKILQIASLVEDDFEKPRSIIVSRSGNKEIDKRTNGVWENFLESNQKNQVIETKITPTDERSSMGPETPSFWNRAQFLGWEKILYRSFLKLWSYIPSSLSKKNILILNENELLKETVCHLMLKGFSAKIIQKPKEKRKKIILKEKDEIKKIIETLLKKRILSIAKPQALNPILKMFYKEIFKEIEDYKSSINYWALLIDQYKKRDSKVLFLTNYPKGVEIYSLAKICNQKNIPFFSFQHGLSREILAAHDNYQVNFENNITKQLFAFNKESERISIQNPFNNGKNNVKSVGLPKDFFLTRKVRTIFKQRPILFVSTALYAGYFQDRTFPQTDIEIAKREKKILEGILNQIPHPVDYKPYPAIRYTDPDPILKIIPKLKNLRIIGTHTDLRYLLHKYRIVITSRATSTIGWCIMSENPMVFVETGDGYALRKKAKKSFKESLFYFEEKKKSFRKDILQFLSQPIEEIERQWHEKKSARMRLINKFFSTPQTGAGYRAANEIISSLNN